MGGNMSMKDFDNFWATPREYKIEPNPRKGPSFDPMLGFPNGRKERVINATKEDIQNWNVPLKHRTYCVDDYITLKKCYLSNSFLYRFTGGCNHQLHDWHQCVYNDKVHDSKEYERERRLQARRKRRIEMGLEEDSSAPQTEAI